MADGLGSRSALLEQLDDRELAGEAVADPDAFRLLYERHVRTVFRFCKRRLGDTSAAEDATSEVFIKAWAGLSSFRGGSFTAWLIVIARHTVADFHRRRRPTAALDEIREPADGSPGPEASAVEAGERAMLRNALAELSEDQRLVLELQLAGWRGPEIAEALNKTPAAVKMLRQRALRRLRAQLASAQGETQ